MKLKRTVNCGELRKSNEGQTVVLNGWVNKRRDHGGLIFLDLRDRYGITQIVFDTESADAAILNAKKLGAEDVVAVKGTVRLRPENSINKEMPTGEIEIVARELEILNTSLNIPFQVTDRSTGLEDLRLKYRFLDLRTKELQKNIAIRHRAAQAVRKFYSANGFYEIETPFLTKSTPEGARDFLVPSRLHQGSFYALPQSPQTYKQLLMISGFDKYFQIVRCFRDEDLRADRQPEFTQIDVEMSFIEEEDIMNLTETMLREVFREVIGVELDDPFPRMSFDDAMRQYGSDKPDLRLGCTIRTIDEIAAKTEFAVFHSMLQKNGVIAGFCAPNAAFFSRKITDQLTEKVKQWGAGGLAFAKLTENGWESGIAKFLSPVEKELIHAFDAKVGDIVFFVSDLAKVTYSVLGYLRLEIAKMLNLIPLGVFRPIWVTRFPLLEWSDEESRYVAMHHPFTSADMEERHLLETEPEKVHARAYDIVINGSEIGGGSIRNHTVEMQERMFEALKIPKDEARFKFGYLLDALAHGAPPHGGIALGFDRLVMILAGADNLREVIAFPKTTSASSLMDGSPTPVDEKQLKELGIRLIK
ncbi:MAG: aspartate--tRNA ligase [Candidatus Marinimicrobia bacterium CG08_land_8_20_14_0_20_45_22]|nr:MAG: aspartate--tRNA ligase [Candidatus Marinimicrobia bacterium CG08_land_8_20_14_0_20_45_22]